MMSNRMETETQNLSDESSLLLDDDKERKRKLIGLITERKELLKCIRWPRRYLKNHFASRTSHCDDPWDVQLKSMNLNDGREPDPDELKDEESNRSLESIIEEIVFLSTRLTHNTKQMKELSWDLSNEDIKMLYEEEKKLQDTILLFEALVSASIYLALYREMEAYESIKFNTDPELALTNMMKRGLQAKVPLASEPEIDRVVRDYIRILIVKDTARHEYDFGMFLVNSNFTVHDNLETIKNDRFHEMNFEALSPGILYRELRDYKTHLTNFGTQEGKVTFVEEVEKKYKSAMSKEESFWLPNSYKNFVYKASLKGVKIDVHGDPVSEVLKMKHECKEEFENEFGNYF